MKFASKILFIMVTIRRLSKMKIISCVLFIASFIGVALAGEWNCADTSGTFELSTDCTMTDEVDVSGDLAVTGNETVYSTLTAASGKRHFKIDSLHHRARISRRQIAARRFEFWRRQEQA